MPPVNRRQFLEKSSKAGIGAGLVGLAGCSGGDGGDGGDGGGDGGDGGDGGGGDGGSDGGSGGPEPVKIGAAISKSGQLAANGKAFSDGYNVMVKWLNEEYGGLKMGGERRPVELVEYDDESNCETTVRLVEKLITEDEVDLVLGPYSSGCTYAAVPAVKKHDMIMIEGAGISDKIFKDHNEDKIWVFGTTPPASRYILGSVRFPASKGLTKVGMFSDQGTFAQGLRAAAKAEIKNQDMEVVVDETVPQDTRDLSSAITKMKNKGAEFAMFNTHLELSVIAHNEAKEQGYNPKLIYGGSGVAETEFWEALGEDGIGTTMYTTWTEGLTTPGNPPFGMGNQKAGKTYKGYRDAGPVHGQKLDPWTSRRANGMQVMQIAAYALEQTGSTDNAKIRETMKNMKTQGVVNAIEFDDIGRTKGIGYCGQRQGETDNPIIYPDNVATGDPVYPKPAWK